ncbi:hypothetical protein [Leptospira stimsonii]|uniref:Uncharacterized protein n=1 Tax=Leptospira stimsonii TaxID=2202203 RepID=A0A8B3D108_9LEPT|nr:hypothetical protein [Leptospira stimsonii]RHX88593.1 hypothetical protein DLM78_06600 [Leptospira stimsonii]
MKTFINSLIFDSKIEINWKNEILNFTSNIDTKLLSSESGTYKAKELIAELKIRSRHARHIAGIENLLNNLEKLHPNEQITNYIFKNKDAICIIYLISDNTEIIGAIIVP